MTDNGARALAAALDGHLPRMAFVKYGQFYNDDPDFDIEEYYERVAAAILANGAVFLPDAAELERLRRIEAAARASRLSVDFYRDLDAALAQKGALVEPDQLRTAVALLNSMVLSGERHTPQSEAIVRAALQPEGSAGTARVGMIEADKRHQERARIAATVRAAKGSAGTRDWLAAHPEIDAALDRSLDEAEVEYAAARATEGSAGTHEHNWQRGYGVRPYCHDCGAEESGATEGSARDGG